MQKVVEVIREFVQSQWTLGEVHGICHWDRVYQNGKKLLAPDINPLVVALFAYLHDSCRMNDGEDIDHGKRAAYFIDTIRDSYLKSVSDEEIELLKEACRLHTIEKETGVPTIDACFDADRLDLWRVGIMPDPERMATEKGKEIARHNLNEGYSEHTETMKTLDKKMLGALAGDIIGSIYEFQNVKSTNFDLFTPWSNFTDDSVMTLAVAKWLVEDEEHTKHRLIDCMQELGRRYPKAGYRGNFEWWLRQENPQPYNSWGNGAGMRVSPIGLCAKSLEEALSLAEITASVSHNHPEGVKGAQAIAASVFLCKKGKTKQEIKDYVKATFGYNLDRTISEIRPHYDFDVSCQGSVPEAIIAFLEGNSFEEVIRLAISLGGDSDTIACMAGAIAACKYPIPKSIVEKCDSILTDDLRAIKDRFIDFIEQQNQEREPDIIWNMSDEDHPIVSQSVRLAPKESEGGCDIYDLKRFLRAQDYESGGYVDALQEIRNGCKRKHWIWYIFPQINGLGHSDYSEYYGIKSLDEAHAYLENKQLGGRLREITETLLDKEGKSATDILGVIDSMKVKSCMTLFDLVSPNDIFERVLEKYYSGKRCELTLKRFEE